MKTFQWLFLFTVASFALGGCCAVPRPDTALPPAVVISPPANPSGHGSGFLDVEVTTRCILRDWIPTEKYTVDGKTNYRFGIPVPLKHGDYILTYPQIPNFVTPPETPVKVFAGGMTKVKITYNRRGVSVDCSAGGKQVVAHSRGHNKKGGGVSTSAAMSPGVILAEPALKPSGAGNGFLTVVWTASESGLHPAANMWWVNPNSKRTINTSGAVMAAGNMTVSFGAMQGYTPPNPTLIHVWQGQTTTLTVTYGHL